MNLNDKFRFTPLFFILVFLVLCGCGYTTHSVVAGGESSIYVDGFVNRIDISREISHEKAYYSYRPAMEADITREVIDRFILDGNYKIESRKNAHFLLKGDLVDFRRDPLRYDTNDNVIEYRLSAVINMELYDLKEDKTLWEESGFAGESTYRTSGEFAKSEQAAIKKAIEDLAVRIVERTVENW